MRFVIDETFLQLDYTEDTNEYHASTYFEERGNEPFDAMSAKQMCLMLQAIGETMLLDEYSLKKLEIFLRTELPFFAVTRRLVFQWVTKNFVY